MYLRFSSDIKSLCCHLTNHLTFRLNRDGRLAEGDQILAIDGQVLEAAISHQAAIGILQRARGVVDLVVARGQLHSPITAAPSNGEGLSPPPAIKTQSQQHQSTTVTVVQAASPQPPPAVVTVVDPVEIFQAPPSAPNSIGRSPSALSDSSKTGGDMVVCA